MPTADAQPPTSHRLARAAHDSLAALLPAGSTCALLDFPDHSNVGDSAIWLGERAFARGHGLDLRYVSALSGFDESVLRHAMPSGIVLVHGGGNFGTVWPRHQAHREQLLRRLADYRIVQLPQSLHFDDDESVERARAAIAVHPDYTLMVRDRASLRLATERLGAHAVLATDAAFLLAGTLARGTPDVDCLVLARSDKERAVHGLDEALRGRGVGHAVADWLDEPTTLTHRLALALRRRGRGRLAPSPLFQRVLLAQWDRLAAQRVRRGTALLSRGRVVVTDRLHAHILATLLGIPHVVLDNHYGKIGRFMAEWTADEPRVRRATSVDEAARLALELLEAAPRGAALRVAR